MDLQAHSTPSVLFASFTSIRLPNQPHSLHRIDPHRKARLAAEAAAAEAEACTFVPQTNETGSRAVVTAIMASETTSAS